MSMRVRRVARLSAIVTLILAAAGAAWAQDVGSGTFAGVVRDTSGAVLPGATVEAASPVLIEKVRSVTSDDEGRYRIAGLRPGSYTVTFTLPGFRTIRREGLELSTGFIATVNADLSVGALEETITVTGEAPIVDTRNASQQRVLDGQVVRELPLGKNSGVYAALLPGAVNNNLTSMDVGGTKAEAENQMGIHGGRPSDGVRLREGNYDGHMFGGFGASAVSSINPVTVQEVTLQLSGGLTAEAQTGGIQSNVIMRDGGNLFAGTFMVDYSPNQLQSSNIDDKHAARGVTESAQLTQNRDFAVGFGGPLKRDRLWFFADGRSWKAYSEYVGSFYNKAQGTMFYEPDTSRPGISGVDTDTMGVRLTWQATPKNKLNFTWHNDDTCTCYYQLAQGLRSPEAAEHHRYYPYRVGQVTWSNPLTSRMLVTVGGLYSAGTWDNTWSDDQGVRSQDISILDRLRNYRYNSSDTYLHQPFMQSNVMGSVAYITGAHAFKVGALYLRASRETVGLNNGSISYTFAGTVPESITLYAYPNVSESGVVQSAIYAQDQWTLSNLTVNLGLRLDMFRAHAPDTHSPAGPFTPARDFAAVDDTVNWKDANVRLGAAYNLFGNDRTAIKVSLGRFIPYEQTGGTGGVISGTVPANRVVQTATRTWRDNGDYIPQEAELGPLSNSAFGTSVINTSYSDDVTRGWHVRPYSWQGSISLQHEIVNGVGLNAGYYRTWYGNFVATDNVLVSPADYDTYCFTGPSDSRLPGGGGEHVCGLKALNPALFGRVSSLVRPASDFGKQSDVYNGVDVTVNMRFGNGGFLAGGIATSQTVTDNCGVLANLPEAAATAAPERFCHVEPGWSAGTQFKLNGSYTLPWDMRATVVYQNVVGAPSTATFVASNAQVTPVLGRPLAGGAGSTASFELVPPKSFYPDGRVNQLDLSVGKVIRFGTRRVQPRITLHNALNANAVLQTNLRYGPAWQNVTSTMPPRILKFGVSVDF